MATLPGLGALTFLAASGFGATGNIQLTSGWLPVAASTGPVDSHTLTWSPRAMIYLASARARWTTNYSQQIWWRYPDYTLQARPFALHFSGTELTLTLTPRLTFEVAASGSAGDLDYSSAGNLLGATQSALPDQADAVAVNTNARAGLRWIYNPRWAHSWSVAGTYADDYGSVDVLSRSVGVTTSLQSGYALSRTSTLTAGASTSYLVFDTFSFLGVQPTIGYSQKLSESDSISAVAGAAFVVPIDDGSLLNEQYVPVTGTLALGVALDGPRTQTWRWSHDGALTLAPRVNRVLQAFLPQLTVAWNSRAQVAKAWTIGARVSFSTNLTPEPQPDRPNETWYSIHVPVSFRPSGHHEFHVTSYGGVRGPHLGARNPTLYPEFSATFGYTFQYGKTASP